MAGQSSVNAIIFKLFKDIVKNFFKNHCKNHCKYPGYREFLCIWQFQQSTSPQAGHKISQYRIRDMSCHGNADNRSARGMIGKSRRDAAYTRRSRTRRTQKEWRNTPDTITTLQRPANHPLALRVARHSPGAPARTSRQSHRYTSAPPGRSPKHTIRISVADQQQPALHGVSPGVRRP
jgi:hypothetical protein